MPPAGGRGWSSFFSAGSPLTKVIPDTAGGARVDTTGVTATSEDYEVVKFADGGARVWVNGGLYGNGRIFIDVAGLQNRLVGLTSDSIGNLYLTGSAWGANDSADLNVVKLNALDARFDSMTVAT